MADRRADHAGRSLPRSPLRLVRVVEVEATPVATGDLRQALQTARRVLAMLRADRATVEQRLASQGKGDPVRSVTGRSAIDAAIAETSQRIRELEAVLGDEQGVHPEGG